MPLLFERVVIAGVGLIGGSLALAARRAGLVGHIVGLGRQEANLALALQRGIIDEFELDPARAARDADLLFLAAPVRTLAPLAAACVPGLAPGAVVSDAGSVKAGVVTAIEGALPKGMHFVGAHPIAGGEQAGAAHADADLFHGHHCIITPSAATDPRATEKITALWRGVGMRVSTMDPRRHDEIFARVSHVPHVLAYALSHAVGEADSEALSYAGSGFRDTTRIAASPTDVWCDIFLANRDAVLQALDEWQRSCTAFAHAIDARDEATLRKLIEAARGYKAQQGNDDDV